MSRARPQETPGCGPAVPRPPHPNPKPVAEPLTICIILRLEHGERLNHPSVLTIQGLDYAIRLQPHYSYFLGESTSGETAVKVLESMIKE